MGRAGRISTSLNPNPEPNPKVGRSLGGKTLYAHQLYKLKAEDYDEGGKKRKKKKKNQSGPMHWLRCALEFVQ